MIRSVVFALIVGGTIASRAWAQAPPAVSPAVSQPSPTVYATPQAPPIVVRSDVPPPPPTPAVLPRPQSDNALAAQKSIARPNPLPARPAAFRASVATTRREALSAQGGFANPGGVGRFSEYYTPNTPMGSIERPPVRIAGFERGGGPDRAEQLASFRAGQIRAQNIQNNINVYGRPYGAYGAGFGFGLGLGIGRGYGYPY